MRLVEAHDSPGRPLYGNDCLSGVDCDGNMGVANDNCCYCMSTRVSNTRKAYFLPIFLHLKPQFDTSQAPAVPTPKPTRVSNTRKACFPPYFIPQFDTYLNLIFPVTDS